MQRSIHPAPPPVNRDLNRWAQSRVFLEQHRHVADMHAFATEFYQRFADCPPGPFHVSQSRLDAENEKAFGERGFMVRLLSVISSPVFVTAHAEHLEMDNDLEDFALFHDHRTIGVWQTSLKANISGPFWYKLELGRDARLHAHAVADESACRALGVVRQLYNAERLHEYLRKAVPWNLENLTVWLEARRSSRRRLPRKSGTVRVPNSRTWRPLHA